MATHSSILAWRVPWAEEPGRLWSNESDTTEATEHIWTVVCQDFEGNGLPFPSPGDLLDPGIESASPVSPALAHGFFTTES